MLDTVLFAALGATAILAGLAMITRRHPLSAALALIVAMVALAGLYALLDASLLAIIQILVYAGAILVLVVFVIMLLNVREEDLAHEEGLTGRVAFALVIAAFLFGTLAVPIMRLPVREFGPVTGDFGTLGAVGLELFREYWFPFELVSLLLTVAIVGAVVLAQRRLDGAGPERPPGDTAR